MKIEQITIDGEKVFIFKFEKNFGWYSEIKGKPYGSFYIVELEEFTDKDIQEHFDVLKEVATKNVDLILKK